MAQFEDSLPAHNEIAIPIIVKGIENEAEDWSENSNVISFSKNNLGFTLTRKCQIGQLLCLDTNGNILESKSDENVENQKIWGIIQRCAELGEIDSNKNFHVGIAVIGDEPPISYFENPSQYYRICGINYNGYWKVEETEKEFITRKHQRYFASIEVFVGLLNESFNLEGGEKVLTENISFGGAAVFSNLKVEIGDCVKFISAKYEFTALSVVRNITQYTNGKQKVHLEFIAGKFPIEKLSI